MMFVLAITRINILPKYVVTLQNVEFRQCKIKYGYLWKIARAFVKNEYFAAILYRYRIKTSVQKSIFIFWWNIALFTYFKTNILKADFSVKMAYLRILFKKQPTIFRLYLSIKLTQNWYTEIPINWSLNYFVEYICMKSIHCLCLHLSAWVSIYLFFIQGDKMKNKTKQQQKKKKKKQQKKKKKKKKKRQRIMLNT